MLAAKLSEEADRRVLVLEAGPAYTAASLPESIRLLSQALLPEHDWAHEADSAGRRIPYTRGKVVGGSFNATMAFRQSPADVDGWGVENWTWDDLLPHLVAVERDLQLGARPWHGDAGPLPITRFADGELTATQAWFADRCRQLGEPAVDDHNDPATAGGVGAIPMNRSGRDGCRRPTPSCIRRSTGRTSRCGAAPTSTASCSTAAGRSASRWRGSASTPARSCCAAA